MSVVKVDVSDREALEKTDFPVLEPGIYEATITKVPLIIHCKPPSENNMVKIEMQVLDGETEYLVFDQLVLPFIGCHQIMHAKLYQFAKCFDVDVDVVGNIDLDEFTHAVGSIRVKQNIYQGKKQHEVSAYLFKDEDTNEGTTAD